ncbi:MAG: hypothetical protein J3K34DRAFT_523142 [Monoraphidium minutum]|nr:MAG: hypothetical protein J3K34DRAFT_523142 [Monoraphidium minutum]
MPDTARAVPYWVDDHLIELSTQQLAAALERSIALEEEEAAAAAASGTPSARRGGSGGGGLAGAGSGSGRAWLGSGASLSDLPQQQQQQQQGQGQGQGHPGQELPPLPAGGGRRLSSLGRSLVSWTAGGGGGGGSVSPPPSPAAAAAPGAGAGRRVTWLDGGGAARGSSSSLGSAASGDGASDSVLLAEPPCGDGSSDEDEDGAQLSPGARLLRGIMSGRSFNALAGTAAAAAAAAAGGGGRHGGGALGALRRRMERRRVRREAAALEDGLMAHAGRGRRRPRWHPVQLLECRDFLHNEAAFMDWLHMAITLASAGVLLLAVGALAFVSPLELPGIHIAEATALLLLPAGCVLVGYAIWVYQWRFRRLTSMRHKRVDARVGPNVMMLVIVAALSGVLLLHAVDLYMIWAAPPGGDDDPGGGNDPGGGPAAAAARRLLA